MSDMSLQDAIHYFQTITAFADDRGRKACEIAILAIATLESGFEPNKCDDLISRQAVLSYINRIQNQGTGKKKSFGFIQKFVEQLPSAEKTSPCDLCKYNPPSSGDGKPCTMCPAVQSEESEGEG